MLLHMAWTWKSKLLDNAKGIETWNPGRNTKCWPGCGAGDSHCLKEPELEKALLENTGIVF